MAREKKRPWESAVDQKRARQNLPPRAQQPPSYQRAGADQVEEYRPSASKSKTQQHRSNTSNIKQADDTYIELSSGESSAEEDDEYGDSVAGLRTAPVRETTNPFDVPQPSQRAAAKKATAAISSQAEENELEIMRNKLADSRSGRSRPSTTSTRSTTTQGPEVDNRREVRDEVMKRIKRNVRVIEASMRPDRFPVRARPEPGRNYADVPRLHEKEVMAVLAQNVPGVVFKWDEETGTAKRSEEQKKTTSKKRKRATSTAAVDDPQDQSEPKHSLVVKLLVNKAGKDEVNTGVSQAEIEQVSSRANIPKPRVRIKMGQRRNSAVEQSSSAPSQRAISTGTTSSANLQSDDRDVSAAASSAMLAQNAGIATPSSKRKRSTDSPLKNNALASLDDGDERSEPKVAPSPFSNRGTHRLHTTEHHHRLLHNLEATGQPGTLQVASINIVPNLGPRLAASSTDTASPPTPTSQEDADKCLGAACAGTSLLPLFAPPQALPPSICDNGTVEAEQQQAGAFQRMIAGDQQTKRQPLCHPHAHMPAPPRASSTAVQDESVVLLERERKLKGMEKKMKVDARRAFKEAVGLNATLIQDLCSKSAENAALKARVAKLESRIASAFE